MKQGKLTIVLNGGYLIEYNNVDEKVEEEIIERIQFQNGWPILSIENDNIVIDKIMFVKWEELNNETPKR